MFKLGLVFFIVLITSVEAHAYNEKESIDELVKLIVQIREDKFENKLSRINTSLEHETALLYIASHKSKFSKDVLLKLNEKYLGESSGPYLKSLLLARSGKKTKPLDNAGDPIEFTKAKYLDQCSKELVKAFKNINDYLLNDKPFVQWKKEQLRHCYNDEVEQEKENILIIKPKK